MYSSFRQSKMVSMGNTVVDMCSQLRDHEINTAIDKEKATDDSDESKQKRKEIKTRGGRALTVGKLAESFDMLGLDIVKKGTGGVVVSLVDEIEETTDDAAWLRVKTGSKKSKVVAKGGYAGVKKPMVYSADVWTKKKRLRAASEIVCRSVGKEKRLRAATEVVC